jgi:hypothetical protein
MITKNPTTGDEVDLSGVLMSRDLEDAYSFLGVQAERLEIAQSREARNLAVPAWSDQDAFDKVLSDKRGPLDDIKLYAERGAKFATDTLKKIEPQVREILCKDEKIRVAVITGAGRAFSVGADLDREDGREIP